MPVRFKAVDILTGRILDTLYPTKWELGDPLWTPGVGWLTFPKPQPERREALVEVTRPRRRWVAAQDVASGVWLWGGPIPRRPRSDKKHVTVPLVDWRGWFYRTYLRPRADGSRYDFIYTDTDQTTIAWHAVRRGLSLEDEEWPGDDSSLVFPPIVVDAPVATEVERQLTQRMLDKPVGEILDLLVNRAGGIEWHTYVTPSLTDDQVLEVHVTTSYPERRFRTAGPIKLEWRDGIGGNCIDAKWPEGDEAPTRVWGVGDGEPPDTAWGMAEDPEGEVVWEERLGPLSKVTQSATAYDHAAERIKRARGYGQTAEFVVAEEKLGLGQVAVGDRARAIFDDGWETADVDNARIIDRILSGGRGQATQQRLVLDLSDVEPPDDGTDPGVEGES